MSDHTPDALASALPAGVMVPLVNWHAREIAAFQAERLAESGYVLLHPEYVDEATVERLAEVLHHAAQADVFEPGSWERVPAWIQDIVRGQAKAVLAALADTKPEPCADGHAMADDDGRCIRCRTTPALAGTSAAGAAHRRQHGGGCVVTRINDRLLVQMPDREVIVIMDDGRWRVMRTTQDTLYEVYMERLAQEQKWGEQNHPDGTGSDATWHAIFRQPFPDCARIAKLQVDLDAERGESTYAAIFLEEVFEALAESDPVRLRRELVQAAAVAVAWVEAIDRRTEAAS